MQYDIVEISHSNKHFHNKSIETFEVFGRLDITFQNSSWSYSEIIFEKSYTKVYEDEQVDPDEYIASSKKTIFFAISEGEVIGQIAIKVNWNRFCFIDDVAVLKIARQKGVASALINKAKGWAIHNNLRGFMLETQDINLAACKLYISNGFELGSVDTMLYSNFDTKDEKALIWYKRFTV
jgi:streptothricin acetyltransferase